MLAAPEADAAPDGATVQMTDAELIRRIRLGEDSTLELKQVELAGDRVKAPGRDRFADELAAFANAKGGVAVLGVDDRTRNVVGIPLDGLDAVEGWVREICNDSVAPPLDADIFRRELNDRAGRPVPVVRVEYTLIDDSELRLVMPAAGGDP